MARDRFRIIHSTWKQAGRCLVAILWSVFVIKIKFWKHLSSDLHVFVLAKTAGCKRSVTGCGSQPSRVKTFVNSVTLILKLNLTSIRNTYIKSCGAEWRPLLMYMFLISKSNLISRWGSRCLHKFSLSNNYMTSLRTTTCDASFAPREDHIWTPALTFWRMCHFNQSHRLTTSQNNKI